MSDIITNGSGLIFMKIGIHARESVEDIIARKKQEYEEAGMIFWGYGGNTCHPTTFVQPFAKTEAEQGREVMLVMHKMNSNHRADPVLAKQYSEDGIDWRPIPKGIKVTGSRYAMVIGGLTEHEFDLNLRNLVVAMGASRGTRGVDYIQGHVDKGCFEYHESGETPDSKELKHIDLYAPLVSPYAVFLK